MTLCLPKERALLDKSCIMNKQELSPSSPDQFNSLLLICKSNNAGKTNPSCRLSTGARVLLLSSLFLFITSAPAPWRAGLGSPVRKWAGGLGWEGRLPNDRDTVTLCFRDTVLQLRVTTLPNRLPRASEQEKLSRCSKWSQQTEQAKSRY